MCNTLHSRLYLLKKKTLGKKESPSTTVTVSEMYKILVFWPIIILGFFRVSEEFGMSARLLWAMWMTVICMFVFVLTETWFTEMNGLFVLYCDLLSHSLKSKTKLPKFSWETLEHWREDTPSVHTLTSYFDICPHRKQNGLFPVN